jgi:RsiW-degrading membrane proteinase PrsW (M82 family)
VEIFLKASLGLLPVLAFLIVLIILDSFKLVKMKFIISTIGAGAACALISLFINPLILKALAIDLLSFARYVAPFVEELLKIILIVYLIRTHRLGFLVDSAIAGFAVGAGFALVENVYYLQSLPDSDIFLWIVRGFGTAAMHGGTTAMAAMIGKHLSDRHDKLSLTILPGLLAASIIHSMYNHFFLPPLISTALLLLLQPLILVLIFMRSEKATENWLGQGLDADLKIYEAITKGRVLETRIGKYLESLNDHFSYNVVADMFEYIKNHLELSMQAKGILLARRLGVETQPDPQVKDMFEQLKILEGRIGPTGKLAIKPFVRKSSRDLWEIHMLSR